jgi:hypothetical protein
MRRKKLRKTAFTVNGYRIVVPSSKKEDLSKAIQKDDNLI